MEAKIVNQEEALHFFSESLQALKNSERCLGNVDGPAKMSMHLQERLHEMNLKLHDLHKHREELLQNISALDKEQKDVNDALQKESMLISQLQSNLDKKAEEEKILQDYKQQYNRRLMKASSNVSAKDLQLLDTLKKKLTAYMKLTGVLWDYPSCNENELNGYIRDIADKKLKMFHMDITGKDRDQIVEEIWKIVEKKSANL